MAAVNRQGAIFLVVLFGAIGLYFLWAALTGSPFFHADSNVGFLGAALFGLFAVQSLRVARHPERFDLDRPSFGSYMALIGEAAGCLGGVLMGVDWLIEQVVGPGNLADELQRTALYVTSAVTLVLLVVFVRREREKIGRRRPGIAD